jgi:transcriptional regulator with PAS, ATPase and Fis domain
MLAAWLSQVGVADAFAALADLPPEAAVFAVDKDRNVVLWSAGAERLLGFSKQEALGAHCLKTSRCARCIAGCGIAEHGAVRDVPLTMHRADGSQVRVRKTARAFFDADGRFAGGVELLVPDASPFVAEASTRPSPGPLGRRGLGASDARYFHGLVSRDPAVVRAFETIRNVAETEASVLVRGESGTGKELVARAVHRESARRRKPFVAVNCAALSPSLIESELFGHVRGAFTGAVGDRNGIFQQADGGTLFLDEVAELPMEVQAKLLRVLQERTITRVGDARAIPVDVRVVAATHRSLREAVQEGRFREDLMYRLRVVPIFLPPLRERRGDIELLLNGFITEANARGPRRVERVAPEAMRRLLDHMWPGNVRELRNVVEYAFAVGRGPELRIDELPPEFREARAERVGVAAVRPSDPVRGSRPPPGIAEAEAIRAALERHGGHIGRAADELGMSRPTFWRKRRLHGI